MEIIPLLLQIAALVFLAFGAFNLFAGGNRPVWPWLGMFCWLLSLMISTIQLHAVH